MNTLQHFTFSFRKFRFLFQFMCGPHKQKQEVFFSFFNVENYTIQINHGLHTNIFLLPLSHIVYINLSKQMWQQYFPIPNPLTQKYIRNDSYFKQKICQKDNFLSLSLSAFFWYGLKEIQNSPLTATHHIGCQQSLNAAMGFNNQ